MEDNNAKEKKEKALLALKKRLAIIRKFIKYLETNLDSKKEGDQNAAMYITATFYSNYETFITNLQLKATSQETSKKPPQS